MQVQSDRVPTSYSTMSVKSPEPQHDSIEANELGGSILKRIVRAGTLIDGELGNGSNAAIELTVVIPVYNEVRTIQTVIASVLELNISKEVIVVDDGSFDGTIELLDEYVHHPVVRVIKHARNLGKGAALQSGFRQARGEIVIVQDADLEYSPSDIMKVIAPIRDGKSKVVFGSRYLGSGHQDQSVVRRFGNRVLTSLSNWMTSQRLTDMETCYKAFRRDLLETLRIEQTRFGFEPEITAKLAKKKITILEVPISYQSRSWKEGKKIGVRDLFNALWCIIRYRFG